MHRRSTKHVHRPALVLGTKGICATCLQAVVVR